MDFFFFFGIWWATHLNLILQGLDIIDDFIQHDCHSHSLQFKFELAKGVFLQHKKQLIEFNQKEKKKRFLSN